MNRKMKIENGGNFPQIVTSIKNEDRMKGSRSGTYVRTYVRIDGRSRTLSPSVFGLFSVPS